MKSITYAIALVLGLATVEGCAHTSNSDHVASAQRCRRIKVTGSRLPKRICGKGGARQHVQTMNPGAIDSAQRLSNVGAGGPGGGG